MALTGVVKKSIDSKGRLSIPKKMRRVIAPDDDVIVLKLDGCLQMYPPDGWIGVQSRIEQLSPFKEKTRRLQRLWGMNADQIALDAEGRLVLTEDQREYAKINNDVVIIGAINKVEIWAMEEWQKMIQEVPSLEDVANEIETVE